MQKLLSVAVSPPAADPENALHQPKLAVLADDFGCVPDGRFLERVSIGAGSAVLTDHNATLRASDEGKNVAIPGAADLVATIEKLAGRLEVERASMTQGSTVLTGRLYDPDDPHKTTIGFRDAHRGMRITVEKAGPQGGTLVSDIARRVNDTTVELVDPAAVSVDAHQNVTVILNRPERVVLSDYARRTVQDVRVDSGDRSIDDGQMTVGALEVGCVARPPSLPRWTSTRK
jgi:hypothetical protein